jgi:hypothetical protein
MDGWIGVDFDGTLAEYHGWQGPTTFGEPILPMLMRVKGWIGRGVKVKIFTARADNTASIKAIHEWLAKYNIPPLEVTNQKDFGMIELWDDRCVQVIPNTGEPVADKKEA